MKGWFPIWKDRVSSGWTSWANHEHKHDQGRLLEGTRVAAINGNIGDHTWNGVNGTIFCVDPKEQMVVVMIAVTPGEIRKVYREKINALLWGT